MRWPLILAGAGVLILAWSGRARAMGVEPVPAATVAEIVARVNAEEFGGWFSVADVLAVVEIESGFDPTAYRSEPQLGDASRGLMQLLLSTALDRGFQGAPEALFDPETNIRLGMRQLKWSWDYLAQRRGEPTVDQWIGSYNAGVGNVLKGYIPFSYVAKWRDARDRWRASGA